MNNKQTKWIISSIILTIVVITTGIIVMGFYQPPLLKAMAATTTTSTPASATSAKTASTATLGLTLAPTVTAVITGSGTISSTSSTLTPTMTVTDSISSYPEISDHYWFSRPFTVTYPSWGSYSYPYGTNAGDQYLWHYGIDIPGIHGTPIIAAGDGTVIHAGSDVQILLGPWLDFYGQAVVIEHHRRWENKPVYTLYGHVSQALVQVGQQVKAGDPIARVGDLGVATGPHLHFEVRLEANTYSHTRNPDLWLQPDVGYGVIAGRVVNYQSNIVPQQMVALYRVDNGGRFWRQTFTYPERLFNSDDHYQETFTFSDVPVGTYLLKAFLDGRQLTVPVTVTNGSTSFALLKQTEPPRPTATPMPALTPVAPPSSSSPSAEGSPPPEPDKVIIHLSAIKKTE